MNPNVDQLETACAKVKPSEADLVLAAIDSPTAFGPLYDRYYAKILNYIYRRTLNVEVAEELTSSTFFHALRGLPAYKHRGYFSAWLYRIATNEIRAYRRRGGSSAIVSSNRHPSDLDRVCFDSSKAEQSEELEEKLRSFGRLHASVDSLPERYQVAISLRYFESLPYAEIAQVMGKRVGTVKSLVHRGLKLLQRHYGQDLQ